MTHRRTLTLLITCLYAGLVAGNTPSTNDLAVPVAPIAAADHMGWSNAFMLRNADMEVVVVPEAGRIVHLSFTGGTNVLHIEPSLRGQSLDDTQPGEWMNIGGDWFWPAAQARWTQFQETDWPPPSPLIDGQSWTGRAWEAADGSRQALITREYGDPLNVRISRTIHVDKTGSVVRVRQHMERTAPSNVPVTLWQISQIYAPEWVILPIDSDSRFTGGIYSIAFVPPRADQVHLLDTVAVFDTRRGTEHKLGSDSIRAWVAAIRGEVLVVERQLDEAEGGFYPDGGCTVEMYANSGLGYVEIETLSTEEALAAGDLKDNTVVISLHRLPTAPTTPDEVADQVTHLVGESKTVPAVTPN